MADSRKSRASITADIACDAFMDLLSLDEYAWVTFGDERLPGRGTPGRAPTPSLDLNTSALMELDANADDADWLASQGAGAKKKGKKDPPPTIDRPKRSLKADPADINLKNQDEDLDLPQMLDFDRSGELGYDLGQNMVRGDAPQSRQLLTAHAHTSLTTLSWAMAAAEKAAPAPGTPTSPMPILSSASI